ncbi:MAG: hypothetical protein K8F91_13060 [Candidatus Obscuribacterales bacterium]|nr:hypothetical protein [Candidatus Obscuribacterales bacterium]
MRGSYLSIYVSVLLSLSISTPAIEAYEDVLLKAMNDEMKRSEKELRFETHPTPYFVSYFVKEVDEAIFTSSLGSSTNVSRDLNRVLLPVIRIGDRNLDSSNPLTTNPVRADSLQTDDDYKALRRSIWLSTDQDYKFAIRTLEWKKAFLSANNVPDRLPDMTEEKPVVSLNEKRSLTVNEGRWKEDIQKLSKVFENYPDLQKSKITFVARSTTRWYINNEGSQLRDSNSKYILRMFASAQAEDGMPISDYDVISTSTEEQMPPFEDMKKQVERFASSVSALSKAEKGIDYCGPVLFKKQAAASFFAQVMAPNLGFAEDYIGDEDFRNPLKNTIGRRILPDFMSVVDNPAGRIFKGKPLVGGYSFDDEGVPGKKVVLIENGRLKELCRSRIPTRAASGSNGHSVGGHGVFNLLELKSSKTVSVAEMNNKLKEAAKDAGLDHILVIESLKDDYRLDEYPSEDHKKLYFDIPSYSRQPSDPVIAYRLYVDDGRKELVRGLEFNFVSLRAFRDIQAVGVDAAPYLVEPSDGRARHLIAPSYLIGELDLRPVKPEHTTLPIVESPLQLSDHHN